MLQNTSSMSENQPALSAEQGLGDAITSAYAIIRRQLLLIVSFALIGTICGVIYLKVAPPVYTAQAVIYFDRGNRPFVQSTLQSTVQSAVQSTLEEAPFDISFFESQMRMLQSDAVALRVVRKLDLAKDPEFTQSSAGLAESLRNYLSSFFSTEVPKSESELEQRAADALVTKTDAKRIGATFFIEISFHSHNPRRAAQIANAIAEAYIAEQMESKYETARHANEWLRQRLEELRRQAAADEQAVNDYKSKNQIVNAGGSLIGEQALTALNTELVNARAKTSETLARLERIEGILRTGSPDAMDATVSDALSSPIITKLREEYLSLVNMEADYSQRYGKDHLATVYIRNKIHNTLASISSELRRLAETSKSEYLIAKKRQEDIERELASAVSQSQATNRAQVTLRDLENAAQSSRSLHKLFQERLLESTQQQSFLFNEARLIEPATAPSQKKSPKTIMVLPLSLLGGMVLGGGLGLLREVLDRVFRSGKQVEDVLHVPCVALVPLLGEDSKPALADQESQIAARGARSIAYRSAALRTVVNAPLSCFAESVRSIKLAADLNGKKGCDVTIGITSSLPNEGKSTVAVALAQVFAQAGRRVLLADCDLRNPTLSRMLAPAATTGLVEVLSGECSLSEAIWTDHATNMAFLPVIIKPPLVDTGEILTSDSTERLFSQLRQSYDYIITDLPPILPVTDVRAAAHLIDFYFLVVEWGRTNIDLVQRALNTANGVYEKLAGVVLNKTNMDHIRHYDSYHYRYYKTNYKDQNAA
jgi:succinoglycan biosynthesis transport protein ExoP